MLSRRTFFEATSVGIALQGLRTAAQDRYALQNSATEWSYTATKPYDDPFNEIELDVVLTTPSGTEHRMPAFWAGGSTWRVRYAPPTAGVYAYRTECNNTGDAGLHGRAGKLTVKAATGPNARWQRGFPRVAPDHRHFEHADGSPFFWLGDTWWMGLCQRLDWPVGFQSLVADRCRKGFTVVQIVAGLYPDMPPNDPRGANEAGFPWEAGYSKINPAYFDMADVRIEYLTDHGIVPCIVGCWGYFLPLMGLKKMKQHWRYLIARWSAYPVIWCLAGEATMPFYLSQTKAQDGQTQKHGWTEIARYVKTTDPLRHPITVHPSRSSRDSVEDASVVDFDMLQTGHGDRRSVPSTVNGVRHSLEASPKMPVLVGEVCYEGIQEASREEIQRFMFWSCMLNGAGGHTYGANGIWQVNTREKPFGLSPHGHSWGGPPWDVAASLPGSAQLGLGKALLSRYSWWKLEPRPAMVEPRWTPDDSWRPSAGEIPGEAVFAFTPTGNRPLKFQNLGAKQYRVFLFNPSDGTEVALGNATPDAGAWQSPEFPIFRDWVIVLDQKT